MLLNLRLSVMALIISMLLYGCKATESFGLCEISWAKSVDDNLAISTLALPVSKSVSSLSFMQLGNVCLVVVVCCAVGYPSVECHYYAYKYVCHVAGSFACVCKVKQFILIARYVPGIFF